MTARTRARSSSSVCSVSGCDGASLPVSRDAATLAVSHAVCTCRAKANWSARAEARETRWDRTTLPAPWQGRLQPLVQLPQLLFQLREYSVVHRRIVHERVSRRSLRSRPSENTGDRVALPLRGACEPEKGEPRPLLARSRFVDDRAERIVKARIAGLPYPPLQSAIEIVSVELGQLVDGVDAEIHEVGLDRGPTFMKRANPFSFLLRRIAA